jgi:hypothetical protein
MPTFKLPLSGDVAQTINPWTAVFSPYGGQFGLVNINLGRSSAPQVEEDVLSDVGSYGKQLGRIGDALLVLLDHFHPDRELAEDEARAIEELRRMLGEIAEVKKRHHRQAPAPCAESRSIS